MTIAISLKVNDGVVLAADSASTLLTQGPGDQPAVVNVYNNADKVFNLVKGQPIGVVTWGSGSIGTASIATLIKDLRRRFTGTDPEWRLDPATYTIEEVANRLRLFMFDEHYISSFADWPQKPMLGFIVAGYSAGRDLAEEYQIDISNGECTAPRLLRDWRTESGITWNGQGEAIQRLILGYAPNLATVLQANLGVPQDQIGPVLAIIQQALQSPLIAPAMPIQDAIDLAEFLVDLTIKFSRFAPGAPTVGGPIEIAAITKHEHFKWIRRKYYYSRGVNPEEETQWSTSSAGAST